MEQQLIAAVLFVISFMSFPGPWMDREGPATYPPKPSDLTTCE
jgi:hypothetical protein